MYYFIKYGYDGTRFTGFQRGNGINSIEDSIIRVLSLYNISQDIESAARTDRWVSAQGNVFLIETNRNINDVMGILNAKIENMFFHSYARLEGYINPRHNSMKEYSYILTGDEDIGELMNRLLEFKGRHDFKNFCTVDNRNTVRAIDDISYSEFGKFYMVNFYGRSFIWHQIRSIMAFALAGNTGPFSLKTKFTYIAPPEPLVLRDIIYDGVTFTSFNYIKHKRSMNKTLELVRTRYMLYEIFNGNI
jgi:tRNA pseudouridine38-40 synthase